MRSLIIHNIMSGFGSNAIFEFERELIRHGDECVLRSLDRTTPVADALRDAEDFDLVVISGGDGTATNGLYALRGRSVPTCIFPSGTANLLFANVGNAPEPAAIAAACRSMRARPLDLGELSWASVDGARTTQGFGIMAGIGLDAQIMRSASASKKTLGEAAYFTAALSHMNPRVVTFTIEVDGTVYQREGISCIVANTAMIQGDINIIPQCRMDDGLLDVMVLTSPDTVHLILPIVAGIIDPLGQTIGRPHIERFQGKHIRVTPSEPLPIQRDGDPSEVLAREYEARCLPASNHIIVDGHSPYYPG